MNEAGIGVQQVLFLSAGGESENDYETWSKNARQLTGSMKLLFKVSLRTTYRPADSDKGPLSEVVLRLDGNQVIIRAIASGYPVHAVLSASAAGGAGRE